jgi:predicted RNase H-like nuclease (RuvC/YqgF family)
MTFFKKTLYIPLISLLLISCWKDKSPEDLIRLKDKFKSTVASFEKKKETANKNVTQGLETLNALKSALEDTKNEDKEFAKVYSDWEKVEKRVVSLNKEYEDLKEKASNLFTAMETQTKSLSDNTSKKTLMKAIEKARTKYNGTLANTSKAIDKLRLLHGDAVEVVKALEVAAALNSFDNINDQMKSIEGRVDGIMQELNRAVLESKKLYEKKIIELEDE